MTRTIYVKVQYDGSGYSGFQRQKGFVTIQETIEKAIELLTGQRTTITGSGRTDAGVHALAQVISFKTASSIPPERWRFALNTKLPDDIKAVESGQAYDGFSARFDAISKTYRYLILPSSNLHAVMDKYSWVMEKGLDVDKMSRAAGYLKGSHDFSSFRSAGSIDGSAVRKMDKLDVTEGIIDHLGARYVAVTARADGFLYKMVRNIVGTLVEVGLGRTEGSDYTQRLLASRDRTLAPPPAPPSGLYLVKVEYPCGMIDN